MDLISLLVTLVIVGLILAVIYWLLGTLPIPAPFNMAIRVIMALIVVVWLLSILLGHGTIPVIRLR